MTEHLWPLLRLNAPSDKELQEAYRQVFIEAYVKNKRGEDVKLYDWNGKRVHFSAKCFDHAFSESSNYRFSCGIHDIPFSKKRARCMLWIKEVLSASKGTVERRHQVRKDNRNRLKKRRVLIVLEEKYVVVLEERPNPGELEFVTAFQADVVYLDRIRKESMLVETKKPQS